MAKKQGIIILETGMNDRFVKLAKIHNLEFITLNLKNNFHGGIVKLISSRLRQKKGIREKAKLAEQFIGHHNFDVVYFSSTEGYISYNVINLLKKVLPNTKFVALQHGVFPLKYNKILEAFKFAFNCCFKFLLGIYPIGNGFGGIILDKYYVYSKREKEFLVKHRGWKNENVKVKIDFLKADLIQKFKTIKSQQQEENAIFLDQCLSLAGLCTREQENNYYVNIINALAKRYNKIYIKSHPMCSNKILESIYPENVFFVTDMIEGFAHCKFAYSYFSTALIDAQICNLKTIGIVLDIIDVDEEIYSNFDLKMSFEEIVTI